MNDPTLDDLAHARMLMNWVVGLVANGTATHERVQAAIKELEGIRPGWGKKLEPLAASLPPKHGLGLLWPGDVGPEKP